MERRLVLIVVTVAIVVAILAAVVRTMPAPEASDGPDLRRDGAFCFPQAEAAVLFDSSDYRVSLYNDDKYLYVQAIVWPDDNDALGATQDGRAIGDRSYLHIDADGNGMVTPEVDRVYMVNIWPHRPGLDYQVHLGNDRRTHLTRDSAGRASVRYVEIGDGSRARVDSFLIPLFELGRQPGQSLRLAVWTRSESPDLTLNSLGMSDADRIGGRNMPMQRYHVATLVGGRPPLDPAQIPRGRDDAQEKAKKPLPKVGTVPPELAAADWINTVRPASAAGRC